MTNPGSQPLRVLIVDDHSVVRAGLEALLGANPGIERVITTAGSQEAFQLCATFQPHAVLLDLQMPGIDGWDVLAVIRQNWPQIPVLVLTAAQPWAQAELAREQGAAGFLNKSETPEVLMEALRTVAGGGSFFPDNPTQPASLARESLTPRELEVLRELARGFTNAEIGHHLGISAQTVKGHLKHLYAKLQVANRAEAVARGLERGLL